MCELTEQLREEERPEEKPGEKLVEKPEEKFVAGRELLSILPVWDDSR